MFTSYFANIKNVKNPLSICSKAPDWYLGPQLKTLAPSYQLLMQYKNQEIDDEEYETIYNLKVLTFLHPVELYNQIIDMYGEDVTLLCYEKPGSFCHRHIVAAWFAKYNNVEIEELVQLGENAKLFDW